MPSNAVFTDLQVHQVRSSWLIPVSVLPCNLDAILTILLSVVVFSELLMLSLALSCLTVRTAVARRTDSHVTDRPALVKWNSSGN